MYVRTYVLALSANSSEESERKGSCTDQVAMVTVGFIVSEDVLSYTCIGRRSSD